MKNSLVFAVFCWYRPWRRKQPFFQHKLIKFPWFPDIFDHNRIVDMLTKVVAKAGQICKYVAQNFTSRFYQFFTHGRFYRQMLIRNVLHFLAKLLNAI